jgi:hypothetical protein
MEKTEKEIGIEIPLDFPFKSTDKILEAKIEELALAIVTTNEKSFGQKYSAITQIGLIEMGNRSNAKNSRFSKLATLFSLSFSIVAISFSFIAVCFANKDDKADTIWQKKQLDSYTQMTNELKELNLKIESLTIILGTKDEKTIKSEGK